MWSYVTELVQISFNSFKTLELSMDSSVDLEDFTIC